jgi:hypothetical protein
MYRRSRSSQSQSKNNIKKITLTDALQGNSSTPKPTASSEELSHDGHRVKRKAMEVETPVELREAQHTTQVLDQLQDFSFGDSYEEALCQISDEDLPHAVDETTPTVVVVEECKARRRYLSSVSCSERVLCYFNSIYLK